MKQYHNQATMHPANGWRYAAMRPFRELRYHLIFQMPLAAATRRWAHCQHQRFVRRLSRHHNVYQLLFPEGTGNLIHKFLCFYQDKNYK